MEKAKWENFINAILGVWLFVSPWVLLSAAESVSSSVSWNYWVVGAIVAGTAIIALLNLRPWEEILNLILGVWLILSPWVMGYNTESALLWNSVISGLAVVAMSGFALPEANKMAQKSS